MWFVLQTTDSTNSVSLSVTRGGGPTNQVVRNEEEPILPAMVEYDMM